jgi:hypothetical protein
VFQSEFLFIVSTDSLKWVEWISKEPKFQSRKTWVQKFSKIETISKDKLEENIEFPVDFFN